MFFGSRKKKAASDSITPEPVQSQSVQSESVPSEPITPQPAEQSSIAGELEDIGVPLETEQQTMISQTSPAKAEQIAEVRSKLHEAYGKVVLAATSVPRYRNLPIGEFNGLFLEPLMRDRIAIATMRKNGDPAAGELSGVAIWASVSEEVDSKIREQIRAGTFPVRLQSGDWKSGDINWLLDVIAPTEALTVSVIANFRQVVQGSSLRIHPIVTRHVDPSALEKIGAKPVSNSGSVAQQ